MGWIDAFRERGEDPETVPVLGPKQEGSGRNRVRKVPARRSAGDG